MLGLALDRTIAGAWLAGLVLAAAACRPLPPEDSGGDTLASDVTASPTTTEPTTTAAPPSDCGLDYDCEPGHICHGSQCHPSAETVLSPCAPQPVELSQWNLGDVPRHLGAADLDGDGDLDLFVSLSSHAGIELAYNDGAGNFLGTGVVAVGPPQSVLRAAAGDFDGDGDVDLAAARYNTGDVLLLVQQDGIFVPGPLLPASAQPWSITAIDLDGDEDRDLVTIGSESGGVSVWINDGVLGPEKFFPELSVGNDAIVARATDDELADLIVISTNIWSCSSASPRTPPGCSDSSASSARRGGTGPAPRNSAPAATS